MLSEKNGLIHLELLAPAKDADTGIAAIEHGADAVYIGASRFGARQQAGNSLTDIARLIAFARPFHVRVYVTLNTLLYNHELKEAEALIWDLYRIGVDAVIVQDMGILQMNLPPIPLHASTQTNNRTPEKVRFLQEAGFKQVVLARELSLTQINQIKAASTIPLEFFVHGALCVSYSGQCYMSQAINGRSANRGECSQPCRLPYDLHTADGKTIANNQHLLSLKDLNLSHRLQDLINAGITSFKIEGRLKDVGYVKNVTAHYRQTLDALIDRNPVYRRSSSGRVFPAFSPSPDKSFSRGFSSYFLDGRHRGIWSLHTPKSMGEKIGKVIQVNKDHFLVEHGDLLSNGDGLCFLNRQKILTGLRANVVKNKKIYVESVNGLYAGATIFRNQNHHFEKALQNSQNTRKMAIGLLLSETSEGLQLKVHDEDGLFSTLNTPLEKQLANKPERALEQIHQQLSKWGSSIFRVESIQIDLEKPLFIAVSVLNQMRRELADKHLQYRREQYPRAIANIVTTTHAFPAVVADYTANVTNHLARTFYEQHACKNVADGFEIKPPAGPNRVMTTKHCIRYATEQCPKINPGASGEQLILKSGKNQYQLIFDCKTCEMQVFTLH
jgi:23S rRNA 5-hydroxycytidine C2501 synthase